MVGGTHILAGQEGDVCSHSSCLGKLEIPNWALCKGGRFPSFWELEETGALDVEEASRPEHVGVRGCARGGQPGEWCPHALVFCWV